MPKLTLVTKFSITSLVLLAGIGVLLGMGLSRQLEQQAIEQRQAAISALVPPVVGWYLTGDVLKNGARGDEYKNIDQALSYIGGLGLVRVRIWNRQGQVIYSDNPLNGNARAPTGPELQQALDGTASAVLIPASESNAVEQQGYGQLLRVYTPLQLPGTGQIAAAMEGYYDADDLRASIDYINGWLWTCIAFGFVFLYTSLFTTVYSASRKLTRQSEENARLFVQSERRLGERIKAEEQTQRQVQRLAALRAIDLAITSSLDLRVTTNVILEQVCTQLQVDAAAILVLNPDSMEMIFAGERGFRTGAAAELSLRPGEGRAWSAALQRSSTGALSFDEANDSRRVKALAGEGFVSYCAVPLIAKGQVKGVLEVFHRSELHPEGEWVGFLDALAGQTAIAVDNATLFNDLQQSNMSLALAYDMTLEGWSRALDLRDKETEGHTQRVTEMTVKLARYMGVSEGDIVHMRRGALLHDIGKMGIPDAVLLKPGPLTDEEWKVMRQHPAYAFQMLSPIAFLKEALDIPHYHHEKWDGSGYPHGLKGEQIPIAARIFAVIDVWDALRSDRPYRKALPERKVYAHIFNESGKHFDPRVVRAFLRLQMGEERTVGPVGPVGAHEAVGDGALMEERSLAHAMD